MQKENYYSKHIPLPQDLRQLLLQAPAIANKQKRERSFWLLTVCFFLVLNIGMYVHYDKQQDEATAASYEYLTQTYQYP
jgi:hypothetical protein